MAARGGRYLPKALTSNLPGFVSVAGELPSSREGERNFSRVDRTFLSDKPLILTTFLTRISRTAVSAPNGQISLQFTKRRMRTFITIPSARNINRTDDPP